MSRRLSLADLATILVLAGTLVAILVEPLRIGHDQAYYLQAGDLMRGGAAPYIDVIDLNPPLIDYLNVIPATIARELHAPLALVFLIGVWLLSAVSAWVTRAALARIGGDTARSAGYAALGAVILSAFALARKDYGQREHLFVLALLPYLAVRVSRFGGDPAPPWLAIATGVATGIAACVKPHFVMILLIAEMYLGVKRRTWKAPIAAETIAMAITGVAYALHFFLLPPAVRSAWFDRWLPLVARDYSAYDASRYFLIYGAWTAWLVPIVVTMAICWWVVPAGLRLFSGALVTVTMSGALSFLLQHKGWTYHSLPSQAAMVTVAACVAARWPGTVRRSIAAVIAGVVGVVVVVLMVQLPGRIDSQLAEIEAEPLAHAIVSRTAPHGRVLIIATSAAYTYPMLTLLDRLPASRYLIAFPLPMLYHNVPAPDEGPFPYTLTDPARRDGEAQFRDDVRRDIETHQPPVIIVANKNSCQGCPNVFTLDDYLQQTGFLATAMRDYDVAERLELGTVYSRRGLPQ